MNFDGRVHERDFWIERVGLQLRLWGRKPLLVALLLLDLGKTPELPLQHLLDGLLALGVG